MKAFLVFVSALFLCFLNPSANAQPLASPLSLIKLPPGFKIAIYAQNVPNAREMTLSPGGILFVGSRTNDKIFAVIDRNKDGVADEVLTVADHLTAPNGVAFHDKSLYVAEISRILRYDNLEETLPKVTEPAVVYDALPTDTWHGWKYIAFGPDGNLYVPIGSPCNVCEKDDERYGSILRMKPTGDDVEIFARGIRNTVGFAWDPLTKELWFTDNGRDDLGNDAPPDELNHAPKPGMNFGFPYCHGGDIPDPEFGAKHACSEFTAPAQKLGPHVASLGMKFYTGTMFPMEYRNQIFIAEHGSWNRDQKIGYRITMVRLDDQRRPVSYTVFAEGWKVGEKYWGRPVDLLVMPDGSMLVSDDAAGIIYRITYEPTGKNPV